VKKKKYIPATLRASNTLSEGYVIKTVPSLLLSCTAEAERSDTDGSFNAFVTLILTLRKNPLRAEGMTWKVVLPGKGESHCFR
jgi:hypothetical protein